jgi:hypothetical protein
MARSKDKKVVVDSDDEDVQVVSSKGKKKTPVADSDDEKPVKKSKTSKKKAILSDDENSDADMVADNSDEESSPKKKTKSKSKASADSDEDTSPKKKSKKSKASSDDEDNNDDNNDDNNSDDEPVVKSKAKATKSKASSDDEDDEPVVKSKAKKSKASSDDEDDEPVVKSKATKSKASSDDEDDEPAVKSKSKDDTKSSKKSEPATPPSGVPVRAIRCNKATFDDMVITKDPNDNSRFYINRDVDGQKVPYLIKTDEITLVSGGVPKVDPESDYNKTPESCAHMRVAIDTEQKACLDLEAMCKRLNKKVGSKEFRIEHFGKGKMFTDRIYRPPITIPNAVKDDDGEVDESKRKATSKAGKEYTIYDMVKFKLQKSYNDYNSKKDSKKDSKKGSKKDSKSDSKKEEREFTIRTKFVQKINGQKTTIVNVPVEKIAELNLYRSKAKFLIQIASIYVMSAGNISTYGVTFNLLACEFEPSPKTTANIEYSLSDSESDDDEKPAAKPEKSSKKKPVGSDDEEEVSIKKKKKSSSR